MYRYEIKSILKKVYVYMCLPKTPSAEGLAL